MLCDNTAGLSESGESLPPEDVMHILTRGTNYFLPPPDFQIFLRPCTACVWVCSSKFANRDDGQDGSLHDFVIEFDMFHMHVELIILSTLLYTKSLYIRPSVRYL